MELLLRGAYLEIFPDLRASVERGLGQALCRARCAARRATVCLRNAGGSRWQCVIRVQFRGGAKFLVQAASPLPSEAVEEASRKLARAAARLAPRPRSERRSRRSAEAQPQWGGRRLSLP